MGVEPTSLAWEARVIAVIRHPHHAGEYFQAVYQFRGRLLAPAG